MTNEKNNKQERSDDSRPDQSRPSGFGGSLKFSRGGLGWLVFLVLGLVIVGLVSKDFTSATDLGIDDFFTRLENGKVEHVVVGDTKITGKLRDASGLPEGSPLEFEVQYKREAIDSVFMKWLADICRKTGTSLRYQTSENFFLQIFTHLLPLLVIFGLIWFFVFRQLRSSAGGMGMLGNFGRSRHRVLTKEHTGITFDDVAGVDEAQEEVSEIIEFLKDAGRFQKLGGRIPRGVLLVGEPGCGKTLLAKAIAGEADVPFFSISGSDFVEMFVGVGASRVRDLFSQAKASAPCIIFLDEIDAVGRRRGGGFSGGGHDEREQTLNAILVEIDGFDSSDQVIVIAATNRADVLDPALTRPGRFDRQVYVPLPDIKGRHEILKVHARNMKISPDADLMRLARSTPMLSGADLAAIINEAAIAATLADKDWIENDDLEEARDKVRWGRARKSRVMEDKEKKETAFHEAGHALVAELTEDADPVHKVSIIPRGQAGGMTMMLPETDRYFLGRRFLLGNLRVLLAGRAAEEIACGDISSGSSDDIKRASQLARTMVCEWGMSDQVGPIRVGSDSSGPWPADLVGREYSEKTAEAVDAEIKELIDRAYEEAKGLLVDHRSKLDAMAHALLKYETLEAEDVKRVMRGESIEKPTVNGLLGDVTRDAKDTVSVSRPVNKDSADQTNS